MDDRLRQHNLGQRDGANANGFDEIAMNFNPFLSDAYRQGFRNGVRQQAGQSPVLLTLDDIKPADRRGGGGSAGIDMPWPLLLVIGLPILVLYILYKSPKVLRYICHTPKLLTCIVYIFAVLFCAHLAIESGNEKVASAILNVGFYLLSGIVGMFVGSNRGRPGLGLTLGLVIPWVGVIIVSRLPGRWIGEGETR